MADISIDFHALPEELRDFVKQAVSDFGLHVVAIRFPPYEAVELNVDQLGEEFADSSAYKRLAFTLQQPSLPVTPELDFAIKNPDALWLQIGERTKNELKESWLSARTEDAAALIVWKKIAKRLQAMTEKGALAMQPTTGAIGPARGHRYTAGAKALEASGVTMITITGIILKLGQTTNATVSDK
jgi:hypothetical protein